MQPAEGKIVYTEANLTIAANAGYIRVDVNNDGIPDFGFYNFASYGFLDNRDFYERSYLSANGSQVSNQVLGSGVQRDGGVRARPLEGSTVDANARFRQRAVLFDNFQSYDNRQGSVCVERGPRGRVFRDKVCGSGRKLLRLGSCDGGRTNVLNGYAHETVLNHPFLTGKTDGPSVETQAGSFSVPERQLASLGLLALGTGGLAIWRRSEETAAI